ncbi:MAG TPA: molybdopterin-dependent oxidoreductase [Solirubrobacteraceae bacterium]
MIRRVAGYCGFCAVHCPVVTTVEGAHVRSVEPDRSHPLGGAICAKGRAAPEFHDHRDRVNVPLRRTRPKTDPDPGWEPIGWGEALDLVARKLLDVRATSGAQAVAFNKGTTGGTALTDTERWLQRLINHFGTPNIGGTTHLCQWPRDTAGALYTFGVPALPMPDVTRSGCIVVWGSNPGGNFLSLGSDIAAARARGAKLLVVDPRRVGLANKADVWLQVRPGTDGALALGLIHLLISDARHDADFVRDWTNAPLLVREDTGMLLAAADLDRAGGAPRRYVAAAEDGGLVVYDAERGAYASDVRLALTGRRTVRLAGGRELTCRPVFDVLASIAADFTPAVVSEITGAPADRIVAAARLLADHRPVSHYFHNGLVQHTNATQASRAIEILYALLGDFDRPGGNVSGAGPRVEDVSARAALGPAMEMRRLGRAERPVGPPATPGTVTAYDLYRAILEGEPYPVRALVAFGANALLANGDSLRGRRAFERLEFFAQVELTETPTSRFADVLLPAASWMECSALKVGQRYPIDAQATIQLREAAVPPLHRRRSDVDIIFDLAVRLGVGEAFWGGDVEAGYRHLLAPSGVTLEELRAMPHGTSVPRAPLRHRKFAEIDESRAAPRGFATPTRKVEIFAVTFAERGLPPLPTYVEPALSPRSRPDLAERFPLVLTNAKRPQYMHSQHRGLPTLRKTAPNPTAEIHPDTAARFGVRGGEWIVVETPSGRVRVQAHLTEAIMPGVVCCSHGWWEACPELGLPGFDPFTEAGANQNLLVLNDQHDPISGGTPHRSTLCRVVPSDAG